MISRAGDHRQLIVLIRSTKTHVPADPARCRVVPLPVFVVETQDGRVREERFIGVLALPTAIRREPDMATELFSANVSTTPATVTTGGRKYNGTRVAWSSGKQAQLINHAASEIAWWVSEDCGAPQFEIPTAVCPVPVPPGCVKFQCLPPDLARLRPGEFIDPDAMTIRGELIGQDKVILSGKTHEIYKFAVTYSPPKQPQGTKRLELWISETIPGHVYRVAAEQTSADGEHKPIIRIKAVEPEVVAGDLVNEVAGMFAFRPPAGWRRVKPPRAGEMARYVAPTEDGPGARSDDHD